MQQRKWDVRLRHLHPALKRELVARLDLGENLTLVSDAGHAVAVLTLDVDRHHGRMRLSLSPSREPTTATLDLVVSQRSRPASPID